MFVAWSDLPSSQASGVARLPNESLQEESSLSFGPAPWRKDYLLSAFTRPQLVVSI